LSKFISGAIAVLCVSLVATAIKAGSGISPTTAPLAAYASFFFSVVIALGFGALVFEAGKAIGPNDERR